MNISKKDREKAEEFMNEKRAVEELIAMSVRVGNRADYVQAGGGNTSVKTDGGWMAVKASGCRLKDMSENYGYVAVNAEKIKEYCLQEHEGEDCSKRCIEIASETRRQIYEEPKARASIEVGFHSVLDTYVLHLHPVYVNVFLCARDGMEKVLDFAREKKIPAAGVKYVIPGYELTREILKAGQEYARQNGRFPQVYFLKNHGIITTAASREETEVLMDQVNEGLKSAFGLEEMAIPSVIKGEKGYKSSQDWLLKQLRDRELVNRVRYQPIYPDQLVYTENELSLDPSMPGKITITEEGISYCAGEKEAMALEETMTALFYIHDSIRKQNMEPDLLSEEECARILGWESEKYRKKLMKNG